MNANRKFTKVLSSYILITFATVVLTLGIYFFKIPNGFSTGGVSGLSIILSAVFPNVSSGTFIAAMTVFFLVIGFIFLGRSFGIKTVYSSLLFSGLSVVLEKICPMSKPFTDEPLLELVFAMFIPAIGSAILFNMDASSGGTEIIAMILKKYTHLDIGKALIVCDVLVACSAFFVLGIETGMFSILGLVMKSLVVDNVIESINLCKFLVIVTDKEKPIKEFIMKDLHHGVTVCDAVGGFTGTEKKMLYVACRRSEALALRTEIKKHDPHAFIFITNTSEIIGKGFSA